MARTRRTRPDRAPALARDAHGSSFGLPPQAYGVGRCRGITASRRHRYDGTSFVPSDGRRSVSSVARDRRSLSTCRAWRMARSLCVTQRSRSLGRRQRRYDALGRRNHRGAAGGARVSGPAGRADSVVHGRQALEAAPPAMGRLDAIPAALKSPSRAAAFFTAIPSPAASEVRRPGAPPRGCRRLSLPGNVVADRPRHGAQAQLRSRSISCCS